jgi:hypothetical protein
MAVKAVSLQLAAVSYQLKDKIPPIPPLEKGGMMDRGIKEKW